MGDFQNLQDTHVKRSSSMSIALRWKHENVRWIVLTAAVLAALTALFLALVQETAAKNINMVINGKKVALETKQDDVKSLLKEQSVKVSEHDRVSLPLTHQLKNGDTIQVEYAKAVRVLADGKSQTIYTLGKTVNDALQDSAIGLGPDDRIWPAPDVKLADNDQIKIVRVRRVIEKQQKTLPYQTVKREDAKLLKGKQTVVQQGEPGLKVTQIEKTFEDGVLKAQRVVAETTKAKSVNKIIAIGTKKPVVRVAEYSEESVPAGDAKFDAKKILSNVTLTAYAIGTKTASGTHVMEGRTIAVDPKVIPLGWWVYIEGIGFRRAEDTGGAIKGNKIDVYFESENYAERFGKKTGYKVYVIGPVKPASD